MILYEVNVEVEAEAAAAFEAWLREHMADVVAAGGFLRAALYGRAAPEGRVGLTAHYFAPDEATLQAYLDGPAEGLRREVLSRFAGRFTTSRRVLRPLALPVAP